MEFADGHCLKSTGGAVMTMSPMQHNPEGSGDAPGSVPFSEGLEVPPDRTVINSLALTYFCQLITNVILALIR